MIKRKPFLSWALFTALSLIGSVIQSQEEIPCAQQALQQYYDQAYLKNVAQVMQLARFHLEAAIRADNGEKLAIVLDVDETALSNRPMLESCGFCSTLELSLEYIGKGKCEAILPTLELYRFAQAHGVHVFFITGRPERLREVTAHNLKSAGYTDFAEIYFRPEGASGSRRQVKSACRRRIMESGYDIIVNIGDQVDDISGGFARHALLVPNPFYTIN
jgi:predicted secreted acid phosphatase